MHGTDRNATIYRWKHLVIFEKKTSKTIKLQEKVTGENGGAAIDTDSHEGGDFFSILAPDQFRSATICRILTDRRRLSCSTEIPRFVSVTYRYNRPARLQPHGPTKQP